MRPPDILFEDPNLIVLSKPAGLLSQGEATGDENLVDWLRLRLGRDYVGLVHRLDRNTSGLMVVAKRSKAANRLTLALREGKLKRAYRAWVKGKLREPGRWEHWLLKSPSANKARAVPPGTPGARAAALSYSPICSAEWRGTPVTLLELELETGRSHQIRAQAAQEGLPLLGDAKYGAPDGFGRTALHSARLEFPHPIGGRPLKFESPLPWDMDQSRFLRIEPLR